ncbi:MAG: caspase family protein, partial [Bacteroidales bacterium]|nr:caspase family protein [Bacteroidales bacterium]
MKDMKLFKLTRKILFFSIYILIKIIPGNSQENSIETVVQTGHYAAVTAVAYSHDGNYIVTGSKDKTIKLWNANDGKEIRSYLGNKGTIIYLEFDNHNTKLLSVCDDGTIKIWDVLTSRLIKEFTIEDDYLISASFNPDGDQIVTGSKKSFVSTWNIETGQKIADFKEIPEDVTSKNYEYTGARTVTFSKDGKYILAGSNDRTSLLWNAKTGELIRKFKKTKYNCSACMSEAIITPDNQFVITSYSDSIKIFDVSTGELVNELFDKKGRYSLITISNDGNYLASVQYGSISVWNLKKGKVIKEIQEESKGINTVRFNPDGSEIITGSDNRMANIWDIKTGETVLTLKGYLNDIDERILNHTYMYWVALINETKLSPDGKYIAIGRTGNNAKLIDYSTGKIYKILQGHKSMVICLNFSNDSKYIATGGLDGKAVLWNVETGQAIKTFKLRDTTLTIFSIDISPDNKYLATADWAGYITIWDIEGGYAIKSVYPHEGMASYHIKFGPNGIYILSSGLDRKLKLIEIDTGEEIRVFTGHTNVVSSINFHPDEPKFVTASWDNTIRVWDFYSGLQVKKIYAHEGGVYSVNYDTSGNYIISGGDDNTAKIWDLKTGNLLNTFVGHKGGVGAVNITSDGTKIITGSRDGTIKTWDIKKNKELVTQIFINENDWFCKTPEGYFDASQGAFNSISFVKGVEIYAIDQFFNEFYRPGLYREVIHNLKGEYRNNILNQVEEFPPPSVEIISPEPNSNFDNNNVMFLVKVVNNGGGVSELKVMQNGKRINVEDEDLKRMKKAGQYAMKTFNLILVSGENDIAISAYNDAMIESGQSSAKVYYKGIPKTSKCYVLSVGINEYENPALNLSFAKPDAKAFVNLINEKGNKLFKKIEVYELFDKQATKVNILQALDEISNQITKEDVFIFFYAGHGSIVNNYFYFITTESISLYQEDKLKQALNVEELQDRFKDIKAL